MKLTYTFKNGTLLKQALTHRSVLNEESSVKESNERLEFLGDALLQYVVSAHLFKKFPTQNEGFLTMLRSSIVGTISLAELADKLQIENDIMTAKGEGYKKESKSVQADAMEAIIGAIFLDGGIEECSKFITDNLLQDSSIEAKMEHLKDPKNILQEAMQGNGKGTPSYSVVKRAGPAHDPIFTVEVKAGDEVLATGSGKSKGEAGSSAAKHAIEKLGIKSYN